MGAGSCDVRRGSLLLTLGEDSSCEARTLARVMRVTRGANISKPARGSQRFTAAQARADALRAAKLMPVLNGAYLRLVIASPLPRPFGPGTRRRKNKGLRICSLRAKRGNPVDISDPKRLEGGGLRASFRTGLPRFARNDGRWNSEIALKYVSLMPVLYYPLATKSREHDHQHTGDSAKRPTAQRDYWRRPGWALPGHYIARSRPHQFYPPGTSARRGRPLVAQPLPRRRLRRALALAQSQPPRAESSRAS